MFNRDFRKQQSFPWLKIGLNCEQAMDFSLSATKWGRGPGRGGARAPGDGVFAAALSTDAL
jgi:hypothetical protein